MTHQRQIERLKYRNWVKGGLAYKYLKDGIEGFADDIVQQDHIRIVNGFKHGPASTCNQCSLNCLKPLHKCVYDPSTGKEKCPWGQNSCNCLFPRKQRCRNHVCDEIFEDILKGHGSTPPTPNWKNTNIQNWCSVPWEIAKCFINAPGYSDKVSAADIDAPGLLHIFVNNINFQSRVTGTDVFIRVLKRRNKIFHSPTMELEDKELNDCIDDIIAILEDDKELKARADAQQAVIKLKQLKHDNFIITTYNEVEVCRTAMSSIVNKEAELKQLIQDTKADINTNKADIESKQNDLLRSVDAKTKTALDVALEELSKQSDSKFKNVKQKVDLLEERVRQLELDNVTFKERLAEIEGHVERLDEARNICKIQLEYIEQKQGNIYKI
ncbi:uncharacterized protein LOC128554003 [Mercenaria mercenaria]|uniref:uncharacterized protein LOC128554003 n=1 Tax=Mercenaria mercenaria TaxID=6596 RepID=UPI00234F0F29|nr:uncharacterized protein LOC128554003 [Mercenaria mercenaria]